MSRFPALGPWAVLPLLATAACAAPEAPAAPAGLSEADRDAIEQMSTEYEEAARAGNFAAVAAFYTADAVVMVPNTPTITGSAAIQAWFESLPPITEFELTNVTVEGAGDVAYVHGTYAMELMMPDSTSVPDRGKYLDIRRRQPDGSWLITHDIFNSDVPLPTEPTPTP